MLADQPDSGNNIEAALAIRLGLTRLSAGIQVIRNEKGWREIEKAVSYAWIIAFNRSFAGRGGVFSVKFNEHIFREHTNPEELIQGVFTVDKDGLDDCYWETFSSPFNDKIAVMASFNLFDAGEQITLDGISYQFQISSSNISTTITLNNPCSSEWDSWEKAVGSLGRDLAGRSNKPGIMKLFE